MCVTKIAGLIQSVIPLLKRVTYRYTFAGPDKMLTLMLKLHSNKIFNLKTYI